MYRIVLELIYDIPTHPGIYIWGGYLRYTSFRLNPMVWERRMGAEQRFGSALLNAQPVTGSLGMK